MNILLLTNRIPFPLTDGGSLAIHYFIEGYLQAGINVSLLSMNTTKHYIPISELPNVYSRLSYFKAVPINNNISIVGAICSLIQNKSYNISRFDNSAYRAALIDCLKVNTFDIIQLESLFLTPYLPDIKANSKAKIILRSHNVEYKIWERLAFHAPNVLKKLYLKILAKQIKKYEIAHLNDYDAIIPISDVDKEQMIVDGAKIPIRTQTFGIALDNDNVTTQATINSPIRFYFLAAMDWMPNQESLQWLLDKVIPNLNNTNTNYELHIAGKNMPAQFFKYNSNNIFVSGTILDSKKYEADKDVLLVPLLSGGGVRIKIFNALSNAKAIITTSVGIEGIEAKDQEHILIADTPKQFAKKMATLINDQKLLISLQHNGQELIKRQYNRPNQIQSLLQFYFQLINNNGSK